MALSSPFLDKEILHVAEVEKVASVLGAEFDTLKALMKRYGIVSIGVNQSAHLCHSIASTAKRMQPEDFRVYLAKSRAFPFVDQAVVDILFHVLYTGETPDLGDRRLSSIMDIPAFMIIKQRWNAEQTAKVELENRRLSAEANEEHLARQAEEAKRRREEERADLLNKLGITEDDIKRIRLKGEY